MRDVLRRVFLARAAVAVGAVISIPRPIVHAQKHAPAEQAILTRTIPSTNESIPAVGMGTWQTFDVDPNDEQALKQLTEVLQFFCDAGGRVIDTAPMYGRAEEVTGLLTDRMMLTDKLFLATKVRIDGERAGVEQMERSLARLKRAKIELMQVHNLVDWQTQLKTLRAWKDRGTFRYIGITHWSGREFDQMERIMRHEKVDFVQLPYSIANRAAETRLLPAARDSGTAVLVMRPFEGGTLFGSVRNKPLPEFAHEFASSWAQLFLKFILVHPAVTCVIPATANPTHMTDNMRAGYGRLPTENEKNRIVEILRTGGGR